MCDFPEGSHFFTEWSVFGQKAGKFGERGHIPPSTNTTPDFFQYTAFCALHTLTQRTKPALR